MCHIISGGHSSEFSFTEFSIFRIFYKAIKLLSRAQVASEMSAREKPIWKITWLLAGIGSLLVVRLFYFHARCQLEVVLSSLPYVPLHRAACNMAAGFIKASKVKNLLARCTSEFCINHPWA